MALTLDQVNAIKDPLVDEYRDRHEAFRRLRLFWHGQYWDEDAQEANSIQSIFRDLFSTRSDTGPDVKLVHNVLQEVCVKFQTFLTPLPMIRVYVDPPESEKRRSQATLKERALYALWSEGRMSQILNKVAWYLPLMGDCFHGIFPDFDKNIPVPTLRSPEVAYPVPAFDGEGLDAVIFAWNARESALRRQFPGFNPEQEKAKRRMMGIFPSRPQESDPEYEVVEYSDTHEWGRWVGDQKLNGVEHKFGFNLFEQMQFIHVPGEPWGHGAVEQFVNLNQAENAVLSLLFQAVLDNVFPSLVLEDASKAPEEIERGPGSVIPLNAGGKAYYLNAPLNMQAGNGMLNELERSIKQGTHMPDVSFGVQNASVLTGKGVDELIGAGTGSVVEMVQGVGIGTGLVSWNEKALYMLQTTFRDEQIYLHGVRPESTLDLVPTKFALRFKGSQIVGSQRNDVVFSPHMDMQTKLVMGLQAMGGGLVSKKWNRENIGIPDNAAMEEEIFGEQIQDAALQMIIQHMTDPQLAEDTAQQGRDLIEGTFKDAGVGTATPAALPAGPGGPPMPGPGGPPGGMPGPPGGGGPGGGGPGGMPIGNFPGGGQFKTPALALPSGSPAPGGEAPSAPGPPGPGAPSSSGSNVSLMQALQVFSSVQLQGEAWLIGEIVAKGNTSGSVEIAFTEPADKQPLQDAAQQAGVPVTFYPAEKEPSEPHIQIGVSAPAADQTGAPVAG